MNAEDAVSTGDLDAALADLQQRVRSQPQNARLRAFLFELLAVLGDWERARRQLKVAAELNTEYRPLAIAYGAVVACEQARGAIFSGHGRASPTLLGEPQPWMASLVEALRAASPKQATQLRQQALQDARPTPGTIDGEPFARFADADARTGPMLEAIIEGRYFWVPLMRMAQIRIEPPADLRDLVWACARLTFDNGGTTFALIPTRYPGSEAIDDAQVRLARLTDWRAQPGGSPHGIGQRLFATDRDDYPLLDTREILFEHPSPATSQ